MLRRLRRRFRRRHAREPVLAVEEGRFELDERALVAGLEALGRQLDPEAHAVLSIAQAPGMLTVKGATPDGDAIPLVATVLHRMLAERAEARAVVRRRLSEAGQREWAGD